MEPVVVPSSAEPPFIITVDAGTSAVRAGAFDRLGRSIAGLDARRACTVRTTLAGAAEADPDNLFELVCECLDDVLARAGVLVWEVGAVGICTFVGNMMGMDAVGEPATPLLTYADTRSVSQVEGLRADFDEAAVHDRTGCYFHPSYWPAQLRWYAAAEPALFRRVHRWIAFGEYLELRLFGTAAASTSVASWSGLLNRRQLSWDEELLAGMPIGADQLSPLVDAADARCGLRSEFGLRWPALRDVPWFPALGDGATANVGSGCTSPTRAALTIGSTGAVRLITGGDIATVPRGLWCYRVDRRRSLPGGALSEGGNVFAWMRESLRMPDAAALEMAVGQMEPDCHGLTVLPFWAGERSPGWVGHARATVHGLTLATTPVDIWRAGLEAIAYRVALIVELLEGLLPCDGQIVASGGALVTSPAWLQIMADVLGRPVVASEVCEASSRGAALFALEALGALEDVGAVPAFLGRAYDPDGRRRERYASAIERQRALYNRLLG